MPELTKKLNLTVANSVHVKLEEVARALAINKTAALTLAVHEYHAKHVPQPQQQEKPA